MSALVHEEEILNLNLKMESKFKIPSSWTRVDIFKDSI